MNHPQRQTEIPTSAAEEMPPVPADASATDIPANESAPAAGASAENNAPPPAESNSPETAAAETPAEGIIFTDNAARKVRALIDEEKNPALMLRVFISGGGCSGFQYGFTFDEERAEDDFALEKAGVVVLVDPMSYQYLVGAEIDYKEGLQGAQFVIRNPNVTSTCGCGSSFSA